jgi:putative ABC transport system substrate-binding protein
MRRREFLGVVCGVSQWPLVGFAQQPAMQVIGFLTAGSIDTLPMAAFRQGLADGNYVEGRNIAIESRWAAGKFDRLPAMAADLVQRRVAVIVTAGSTSGLAAKAATTTIPIVFLAADDPVKFGLVASLSRPGGNATGLNLLTSELTTKRLALVREFLPTAASVAVLANTRSPEAAPQLRDLETAARNTGQQIRFISASSELEIDTAFADIVSARDAALLVTNDALFDDKREQLVALAARHAIPTIYDRRSYVTAGGLMSYGTNYPDGFRRLGLYTTKVLNGAKPSDLPVEQATKFELVINLKTAQALNLAIPPKLLFTADEVIE